MIKESARRAVRDAIKRGELVRPDTCQKCGTKPPRARDGRSNIHGHHHDYSKPLDVEWICAMCHRKETPLPEKMGAQVFGSRNGAAKLTEADVVSARRLRAKGLTYKAIAERFGVDKMTALRAIKGQWWAHVDDSALSAAPAAPQGEQS